MPRRTVRVTSYKELKAACQSAQTGDEIVLSPGVYTVAGASRIAITGKPGAVTVRGATGRPGDVVVEGAGQDNPAVPILFDLTDSPGWTFADLTTRNTFFHAFKFNGTSTDCVLRNVVMREHGEGGVKGTVDNVRRAYPDRLRIDRCDIGHTTRRGGTRDVVEGIDGVGVRDWIIRDCRFVNITKGDRGMAYAVFTKGNAQNTIIERCRFEDCDIGASFGGGGTGATLFRDNDRSAEHRNGIIRNNVFIRCRDAGVYINKGRDCKIYHNTLFECVLGIQLRYKESVGAVRNNLVLPSPMNPDEAIVRAREGATLTANEGNLVATVADFVRAAGDSTQIDLFLTTATFPRHCVSNPVTTRQFAIPAKGFPMKIYPAFFILFSFCLISGCSPQKAQGVSEGQTSDAAPPASAQSGRMITLEANLKVGDKYRTISEFEIIGSGKGTSVSQKHRSTTDHELIKIENGEYTFKTLENEEVTGAGASDATPKKNHLEMVVQDKYGNTIRAEGSEFSIVEAQGVNVPKRPIHVGESWISSETSSTGGKSLKTEQTCHLNAITNVDGIEYAVISMEGTMTAVGGSATFKAKNWVALGTNILVKSEGTGQIVVESGVSMTFTGSSYVPKADGTPAIP